MSNLERRIIGHKAKSYKTGEITNSLLFDRTCISKGSSLKCKFVFCKVYFYFSKVLDKNETGSLKKV